MNWYSFVFVWLIIMAFVSLRVRFTDTETVSGYRTVRWKPIWAFVLVWPIFYLAVFTPIRFDGYAYMAGFRNLPDTWSSMMASLEASDSYSGIAFTLFGFAVKSFFGSNETIYRFLIGLLHMVPVVLIFRKYSENYLLSIFLFLTTGCHLGWLMNGMRQFIAVAIILAATPLLIQKKMAAMVLVVLFAALFHTSAIIMLPVIFIVQGEPWNKKTFMALAAAIIAMLIFSRFSGALDTLLAGTEYEGLEQSAEQMGDDGVHPLRVLVSAVPPVLAFIGRKQIAEDHNTVVNICINMSIMALGINLIAMVTSGVMIGRLPIYMSIYSMILLPYLVPKVLVEKYKQLGIAVMVACYSAYYIVLN